MTTKIQKGDTFTVSGIEGDTNTYYAGPFPCEVVATEDWNQRDNDCCARFPDGETWWVNESDIVTSTNPKDLIGVTKPPLTLVPPAAIIEISKAMQNGAQKYGAYNWRENAVQAVIYLDAAARHLAAFLDGEDVAEDSGVKHLAHAAACLCILLDAEATGNLVDNRPTPGAAARLIKEATDG